MRLIRYRARLPHRQETVPRITHILISLHMMTAAASAAGPPPGGLWTAGQLEGVGATSDKLFTRMAQKSGQKIGGLWISRKNGTGLWIPGHFKVGAVDTKADKSGAVDIGAVIGDPKARPDRRNDKYTGKPRDHLMPATKEFCPYRSVPDDDYRGGGHDRPATQWRPRFPETEWSSRPVWIVGMNRVTCG